MALDVKQPKGYRKAWNGGQPPDVGGEIAKNLAAGLVICCACAEWNQPDWSHCWKCRRLLGDPAQEQP